MINIVRTRTLLAVIMSASKEVFALVTTSCIHRIVVHDSVFGTCGNDFLHNNAYLLSQAFAHGALRETLSGCLQLIPFRRIPPQRLFGGSGGIEPPESSELQVKNIVKNMYRNDKTFLPLWYYHSIFWGGRGIEPRKRRKIIKKTSKPLPPFQKPCSGSLRRIQSGILKPENLEKLLFTCRASRHRQGFFVGPPGIEPGTETHEKLFD